MTFDYGSISSKIPKIFRLDTVKKKLIWYSFFVAFIICSFSIYSFFYIQRITLEYNSAMNDLYQFNKISVKFNTVNDSLDYVLSVSSDSTKESEILYEISQIIREAKNIEAQLSYSGNWVSIAGLRGLLETYSTNASKAFDLFNKKQAFFEQLSECRSVSKFFNKKMNEIMNNQVKESSQLYTQIEERNKKMQRNIIITLMVMIVFNSVIVIIFSDRIGKPIRSLVRRAEKIASGDLNVDEVIVRSNDEIFLLASAFNKMSENIRILINQITEKSYVEKKLKEEEMKNLQMAGILRDTELKVLQSQINPHFLFNTLNTIARMAMLENADTTLKLIESTSELLRYNLGKIKQGLVTLRNEIENVKEYIFILEMRFSDRITFKFDIDESLLDTSVPYLLLQPLVENAFIHGLEPKEGNGCLALKVFGENDKVVIEIKDNGIGIDQDRLTDIFKHDVENSIGLLNVKSRLEYYFNQSDLIKIWSKKGQGTVVTIKVPVNPAER